MALDIQANPHHFDEWGMGKTRSRWDYDCPDYTLDDMMAAGERYFRSMTTTLRSGDIVHITDSNNKRASIIINIVDDVKKTVAWDLDIIHGEKIVVPPGTDYAIRHRGRGMFAIIDRKGEIVQGNIASRDEAERRLANLLERQEAKAA